MASTGLDWPSQGCGGGTVLQVIIQGRGGQGAQTAGNLLAMAHFAAGQQVQAFSSYGGARRGTPVSSFIRVDDRPIRLRCDIERADAILCFDASLLDARLLAAARADTLIVVNSMKTSAEFASRVAGLPGDPGRRHRDLATPRSGPDRELRLARCLCSSGAGARSAGIDGHDRRRSAETARREHRRLRRRLALRRCAVAAAGRMNPT
jgi:Pyruvate/2-oxoacid:ferredoxin oxidoreductase gamma subunit